MPDENELRKRGYSEADIEAVRRFYETQRRRNQQEAAKPEAGAGTPHRPSSNPWEFLKHILTTGSLY